MDESILNDIRDCAAVSEGDALSELKQYSGLPRRQARARTQLETARRVLRWAEAKINDQRAAYAVDVAEMKRSGDFMDFMDDQLRP